jgi:hypothetical protein
MGTRGTGRPRILSTNTQRARCKRIKNLTKNHFLDGGLSDGRRGEGLENNHHFSPRISFSNPSPLHYAGKSPAFCYQMLCPYDWDLVVPGIDIKTR